MKPSPVDRADVSLLQESDVSAGYQRVADADREHVANSWERLEREMTLAIDALKARVKPLLAELEEIGSDAVLLRRWNMEAQTLLTFIRIAQMGETDCADVSPPGSDDA